MVKKEFTLSELLKCDVSDPDNIIYPPRIAGGSFEKEDWVRARKFEERELAEMVKPQKNALSEPLYERLKQSYPGLPVKSEKMPGKPEDRNYKKFDLPEVELQSNDLCMNGTYCVSIPEKKVIEKLFSADIEENSHKDGLSKLWGYTRAVQDVVAHLLEDTHLGSRETLVKTWREIYRGRVISLEKFILGDLPAVCFEQALSLSCLIAMDPGIKMLGGKVRIGTGYYSLRKNRFGLHAWVKLSFPKKYPEHNIHSTTYILDPAQGGVFEYRESDDSTFPKYVQCTDGALRDVSGVFRPKIDHR